MRIQLVLSEIPRLKDIKDELAKNMRDFTQFAFSGDRSDEKFKEYKAKSLALQQERKELLKKYGYPENQGMKEEKVTFKESLKLTFGNKTFLRWLVVNCCTFFGLQMFLVGMNAMIIGGMGFNGAEMAMANTCAIAPVPVMLYFFNKNR